MAAGVRWTVEIFVQCIPTDYLTHANWTFPHVDESYCADPAKVSVAWDPLKFKEAEA